MIDLVTAVALAAAQRPTLSPPYTLVAATSVADSGLVARTVMPAGAACGSDRRARRTSQGVVKKTYSMKVRVKPAATAKPAFNTVRVCSRSIPLNEGGPGVDRQSPDPPVRCPRRSRRWRCWPTPVAGSRRHHPGLNSPAAWLKTIARRIAREEARHHPQPWGLLLPRAGVSARGPGAVVERRRRWPGCRSPIVLTAGSWMSSADEANVPQRPDGVVARQSRDVRSRRQRVLPVLRPRPDTAGLRGPVNGVALAPATTPDVVVHDRCRQGRTLRVAMVDSAYGGDSVVDSWAAAQRPHLCGRPQADQGEEEGRQSWLMTHRELVFSQCHIPVRAHAADAVDPVGIAGPDRGIVRDCWTPITHSVQPPASPSRPDPRSAWQPRARQRRHVARSNIRLRSACLRAAGQRSGQRVDPRWRPYPNPTMSC